MTSVGLIIQWMTAGQSSMSSVTPWAHLHRQGGGRRVAAANQQAAGGDAAGAGRQLRRRRQPLQAQPKSRVKVQPMKEVQACALAMTTGLAGPG